MRRCKWKEKRGQSHLISICFVWPVGCKWKEKRGQSHHAETDLTQTQRCKWKEKRGQSHHAPCGLADEAWCKWKEKRGQSHLEDENKGLKERCKWKEKRGQSHQHTTLSSTFGTYCTIKFRDVNGGRRGWPHSTSLNISDSPYTHTLPPSAPLSADISTCRPTTTYT